MVQHRPLKDMEGDLDDMDEDLDARFWEPHGTAHGDGTPRAVCRSGIVDHVSHVGRKLTDFGVFRGFFIKKATKKSELSGAVCTLATCAVARRCAWCCNEIRGRVGWLELTCRKGDMI